MSCELCDGSEAIEQVGEESGHVYIIERNIDEDGIMYDYFSVREEEANGNVLWETFTPDLSYCPNCGAAL